ncbi:MAG: preprotein translocase subunit SecE [Bacteroidetes bacterium]|nr:preprotein translocase subunit SecE [Bacteroidota bacterium]
MDKLKIYVQESYNELMHKVSWPTWAELQESAITVLVATVIVGLIIWLIDLVFSGILGFIYSLT